MHSAQTGSTHLSHLERALDPQHILLPSDLSQDSLLPVQQYPEMFQGRTVTLLSVVQNLPLVAAAAAFAPTVSDPSVAARVEKARVKLTELSHGLEDAKEVRIEVIVGADTGSETAHWAAENGVDLIALSTHGRSGWRRLVLGSIAEAILRHATVPVMAFPAKETA